MDPADYFRDRRQGDILSIQAPDADEPEDYVVVSQSCDVVLPNRENVLLAPLVELHDDGVKRGAQNRENPRYAIVPLDSETRFADLNCISAYAKDAVAGAPVRLGIDRDDDQAVRDFGLAVGRWFGRFAFPDEIQPWLAPLQKQIRDKYASPSSPLGLVLHRVTEIRVEADSWTSRPCTLTIHVIVNAVWMPVTVESEDFVAAEVPVELTSSRPIADVAVGLLNSADDAHTIALWDEFAWGLAQLCTPKGRYAEAPEVKEAVAAVEALVWTDEEFPLVRYRRSEQLDVDFLSDPSPL